MTAQLTLGHAAVGVLGHVANGLVRIPAFLANGTAAMLAGEVSLRVLSGVWTGVLGVPKQGGFISQISEGVRYVRPFGKLKQGGEYALPTSQLIALTVGMTAISALGNEAVTMVCGPAPRVYNDVLAIMGPLKLDSASLADRARRVFS